METILNLVWLVITLVGIWLWRYRWIDSRQSPTHSTRTEAVAMLCLLALLFPVISLTDDLHPEIVAVDAASGKRNGCLSAAIGPQTCSNTANLGTHLGVGLISRPFTLTTLIASEFVFAFNLHDLCSSGHRFHGRSPPFSL